MVAPQGRAGAAEGGAVAMATWENIRITFTLRAPTDAEAAEIATVLADMDRDARTVEQLQAGCKWRSPAFDLALLPDVLHALGSPASGEWAPDYGDPWVKQWRPIPPSTGSLAGLAKSWPEMAEIVTRSPLYGRVRAPVSAPVLRAAQGALDAIVAPTGNVDIIAGLYPWIPRAEIERLRGVMDVEVSRLALTLDAALKLEEEQSK